MAQPVAVLLVVGLNETLLAHAPQLRAYADKGHLHHMKPCLPAVTTSSQASMLTGKMPREHGIVANGWYNRDMAEVQFWKQSNRLVQTEKVWETARRRDRSVTCAKLFWWYNMYSSADVSVTPRPMYKADGRKIPDIYTQPAELRHELQEKLGRFPLFNFWGPASSIASSQWISGCTKHVVEKFNPTLSLVYLPHLDYALQKVGPGDPSIPDEVRTIDEVAGDLVDWFTARGRRVLIVSEYGIEAVDGPVHINRALRAAGQLQVREEQGLELLDTGASDAFAVADHQIAHVYVRDADRVGRVKELVEKVEGVGKVLDAEGKAAVGLDHPRSGELVLVAAPNRWFTYYYWFDDARAPDFARTVDIHRKPGFDPVEMYIDPKLRLRRAAIGWKLLKRKLGLRQLLDVIPLDATLVRGSHGRIDLPDHTQPVLIEPSAGGHGDIKPQDGGTIPCTAVHERILFHLGLNAS